MPESGKFNIGPDQLTEVIALCSEDSIFVAGILLTDPSSESADPPLHHHGGQYRSLRHGIPDFASER